MNTALTEKVVVSTVMTTDIRDRLMRLAAAGDRSMSAEVRRAVVEHLERTEGEKT